MAEDGFERRLREMQDERVLAEKVVRPQGKPARPMNAPVREKMQFSVLTQMFTGLVLFLICACAFMLARTVHEGALTWPITLEDFGKLDKNVQILLAVSGSICGWMVLALPVALVRALAGRRTLIGFLIGFLLLPFGAAATGAWAYHYNPDLWTTLRGFVEGAG